jgi:hypothetical protein
MFAWSSNELWGNVGLSSREIAVVDAVAASVSLKIAHARGPHSMGRCVSPAKALVANTIASERGTPYDNHGGAARRRRSPGPSARVAEGEIRTPERAFNTMAGSLGDAHAELADPGHGSSRRPTRPGASSGTITIHSRRARAPLCG